MRSHTAGDVNCLCFSSPLPLAWAPIPFFALFDLMDGRTDGQCTLCAHMAGAEMKSLLVMSETDRNEFINAASFLWPEKDPSSQRPSNSKLTKAI